MRVKTMACVAAATLCGLGAVMPTAQAASSHERFHAVVTSGESLESVLNHARATQGAVVDRVVAAQTKAKGSFSIPGVAVQGTNRPFMANRPAPVDGPVLGQAVDQRRAWQMQYSTEYADCDTSGCAVTNRLSFTVRFQPGNTSTAVTVSYTYAPSTGAFRTPGFDTSVYIGRDQVGTTHVDTMSSTTQTVTVQHAPLRGQRFTDDIETYTRLNGTLENVGSYTTAEGKCSNAPSPTCHF